MDGSAVMLKSIDRAPRIESLIRGTGNADTRKKIAGEGFAAGQTFTLILTIDDEKIHGFADLSGDRNPLHLHEEYAKTTRFKGRIAHGMLVASYISTLIAGELPGAVYSKQDVKFLKQVNPGDTVKITVLVTDYKPGTDMLTLDTRVTNQNGAEVIKGEAIIWTGDILKNLTKQLAEGNEPVYKIHLNGGSNGLLDPFKTSVRVHKGIVDMAEQGAMVAVDLVKLYRRQITDVQLKFWGLDRKRAS